METKIVRNESKPGSKPIKAKSNKRKESSIAAGRVDMTATRPSPTIEATPVRSILRKYPLAAPMFANGESEDFKRALENIFGSRGLLPTEMTVQEGSSDPVFAVILRLLKESEVSASKDLLNYYYLFNDAYTQDAYDYYYSQAKKGDAFARARLGQLSKQGRLQTCSTELQIVANAFSYECDAASEKLKMPSPQELESQESRNLTALVETRAVEEQVALDEQIASVNEAIAAVEALTMGPESVKDVVKKLQKRSKTTKKKSSRSNKKRS